MQFIVRNFTASQNNEGGTTKMSNSNYEPSTPHITKTPSPIQEEKAVISTFLKITHQLNIQDKT